MRTEFQCEGFSCALTKYRLLCTFDGWLSAYLHRCKIKVCRVLGHHPNVIDNYALLTYHYGRNTVIQEIANKLLFFIEWRQISVLYIRSSTMHVVRLLTNTCISWRSDDFRHNSYFAWSNAFSFSCDDMSHRYPVELAHSTDNSHDNWERKEKPQYDAALSHLSDSVFVYRTL